jgi:hypothetical protein
LYRAGAMDGLMKEMDKHKVYDVLQEIRWPEKGNVIQNNYIILYNGHKSDKHECGTGFYIIRHIMDNLVDLQPVHERICKIWFKLKYQNLRLI